MQAILEILNQTYQILGQSHVWLERPYMYNTYPIQYINTYPNKEQNNWKYLPLAIRVVMGELLGSAKEDALSL